MNLDRIKDINWEEASNFFKDKEIIENHQIDSIKAYIKTIPDNKLDVVFQDFLTWEEKYERAYYKRGIQTNSTLFYLIIKIIEEESTQIVGDPEDFLANAFVWREYTFKLFQGQGAFWRISIGELVVFQNE